MKYCVGDRIKYVGKEPWKRWLAEPPSTLIQRVINSMKKYGEVPDPLPPKPFEIVTKPVLGTIVEPYLGPYKCEKECWWAVPDDPTLANQGPSEKRWLILESSLDWELAERPSIDELLTSENKLAREEGARRKRLERPRLSRILGRFLWSRK